VSFADLNGDGKSGLVLGLGTPIGAPLTGA
jgi:hypothetical protein